MKEERMALIEYRLEQADESLESARILYGHKKFRPPVRRQIAEVRGLKLLEEIKSDNPGNVAYSR
jgi:hypothetical protein